MKKIILILLIFSCKNDELCNNKELKIFQKKNICQISAFNKNDNLVLTEEYVVKSQCKIEYNFGSNNILREIKWFHKNKKPFAYRGFKHLFYNDSFYYNFSLLDTNEINIPIINYTIIGGSKYFEIIIKDYPVSLVGVGIQTEDTCIISSPSVLNNTWYMEYSNIYKTNLIMDFIYKDIDNNTIKEIKNVIVKPY